MSLPRQFVLDGPACAGLAPNASCEFGVRFLPLANGAATGTIFVQAHPPDGDRTYDSIAYLEGYGVGSGTILLSGNLLPGGLLNFGQVGSGQSLSQTVMVTNGGASAVTVRRVISEWPFLATTDCGLPLAPGASCGVTVTYTPIDQISGAGGSAPSALNTGSLVIESDAASSPDVVDLVGTVSPIVVTTPSNTAPFASLVASAGSLSFAATRVGSASEPQVVRLSNTGSATILIDSLRAGSDFSVSGDCRVLVPASSCDVAIAFTPQIDASGAATPAEEPRVGALEISSNASTALEFVSLLGTANPGVLAFSPAALNFGNVIVGQAAGLAVQVTNTSSSAVTFSGIVATGDYGVSGSCSSAGGDLAASASCTLQIEFAPSQTGVRPGVVSLVTSDSSMNFNLNLTGSGIQSHLEITPVRLDFGSLALGSSANLSLSLTNTGSAALSGLMLAAGGDYAVTTPCRTTTLAPGASCSATVTFTPSATGDRSATLTVTSSDPSSPESVILSGSGIESGSFLLSVDGGSTSTVATQSGHPANYTLTLTPQNAFAGDVVFNCTPVQPAQYATCSILPSSLTLGAGPQSATVAINTVTSQSATATAGRSAGTIVLCLCCPLLLLFRTRRGLGVNLAAITLLLAVLTAAGCGGGGDPSLRYTPTGTYQYQITATSVSGTRITRTVTLMMNVSAR